MKKVLCLFLLLLDTLSFAKNQYKITFEDQRKQDDSPPKSLYLLSTNHTYPFSGWDKPKNFDQITQQASIVALEHFNLDYGLKLRQFANSLTGINRETVALFRVFEEKCHDNQIESSDAFVLKFCKKYVLPELNKELSSNTCLGIEDFDAMPRAIAHIMAYLYVRDQSIEAIVERAVREPTVKISLDNDITTEDFAGFNTRLRDLDTINLTSNPQEILQAFEDPLWPLTWCDTSNTSPEKICFRAFLNVTFLSAKNQEEVVNGMKTFLMMKNKDKKRKKIQKDRAFFSQNLLYFERGLILNSYTYDQVSERNISWLKGPILKVVENTDEISLVMFGLNHLRNEIPNCGILNFFNDLMEDKNASFWKKTIGDVWGNWKEFKVLSVEYVDSEGDQ